MTVGEFLSWREASHDAAGYELVAGIPLRLMAPTSIRHADLHRLHGDIFR
jgi:hypothetical protein